MKNIAHTLNEYANEFISQHGEDIVINVMRRGLKFEDYMNQESTFDQFIDLIIEHDKLKLVDHLGLDKYKVGFEKKPMSIINEIKPRIYKLIKLKIVDDLRKELDGIDPYLFTEADKKRNNIINELKRLE